MRKRRLTIVVLALSVCAGRPLAAQAPADCAATILVNEKLDRAIDVRADLASWIAPNARLVVVPDSAQMKNRQAVAQRLVRSYPRQLLERGIGGETVFVALVDTTGRLAKHRVLKPSAYAELDRVAESTIKIARFEPFRTTTGCAVPALWRVPIEFWSR